MVLNTGNCEVIAVPDLKNNAGITVLHWNSRSMYHKFDDILHIVEGFNCEFLFLSETWLSSDIDDGMITIPVYQLLRQDRDGNSGKMRGGGGCECVYYENRFVVTLIDSLSFCSPDVELLTMRIKLENTRHIYCTCAYRPPSGNVEMFIKIIDCLLGKVWNKAKIEFNMVGDVNINLNARGDRNTNLDKELCSELVY